MDIFSVSHILSSFVFRNCFDVTQFHRERYLYQERQTIMGDEEPEWMALPAEEKVQHNVNIVAYIRYRRKQTSAYIHF